MQYTDDRDVIRAYARKDYERKGIFNPVQFAQEFNNILTTKKMVSRFLKSGSLNEKLMINNVVMAMNSFGVRKVNILFRMACQDPQYAVIKAILLFLKIYQPDVGSLVDPNRIMVDILKDMSVRYNLGQS